MQNKDEMLRGWDFAAHLAGVNYAASGGDAYVSRVAEAIEQLEKNINEHPYRGLGIPQFQGYVAEEWSAGTFNIDAVAAGSKDAAHVLHSLDLGSVDVHLDSGADYSMKSFYDGVESAKRQALLNPETRGALYHGQRRWVPSDQLEEAKGMAHKQMLRNQGMRPDVAAANAETEAKLTDVVRNAEGVQSRSASRDQLDRMARDGKKGEFKAAGEGVTLDSAVKIEYMVQQALKAGYTAAAITVVMQMAPEIYKAIDYLIKNGEIDVQQIKRMGKKAITAGTVGFLRGSVSCCLLLLCEKGVFGEAMKAISPTLLGSAVAIVMETVKNSILVAAGKMTTKEMGAAFADTVIVSAGFIAGMKIGETVGGIIGQTLGFELPVVGYLIGSLVGCAFAAVYQIGKKQLISFCVDSGFTCFGLVEQNYELPEDVLKEMGVTTIPISRTDVEKSEVSSTGTTSEINRTEYETIAITVLRRGVIGVNRVGYVPA